MNVMNDTLNNWIEDVDSLEALPQMLLPQLFQECFKEVEARHKDITAVLYPAGKKTETMRNHLLKHHKELFYLVRDEALRRILEGVEKYLCRFQFDDKKVKSVVWGTNLRVLAHAYRRIIVNVLLQDPPVSFSSDCGRVLRLGSSSPPTPSTQQRTVPIYDAQYGTDVWRFEPELHSAKTVDSNPPPSQLYLVVFPAIIMDGKPPLIMSSTLGYHFNHPQQREPDTPPTQAGAQVGCESRVSTAQDQRQATGASEPRALQVHKPRS
ncbi:unnamed protein product [Ectocarpus fasciculatus]